MPHYPTLAWSPSSWMGTETLGEQHLSRSSLCWSQSQSWLHHPPQRWGTAPWGSKCSTKEQWIPGAHKEDTGSPERSSCSGPDSAVHLTSIISLVQIKHHASPIQTSLLSSLFCGEDWGILERSDLSKQAHTAGQGWCQDLSTGSQTLCASEWLDCSQTS